MDRLMAMVSALFLLSATGCNHAVAIRMADNSPAEISVDGKNLGKAPVTYQDSWGLKDSVFQIVAKRPDGSQVKMEGKRTVTGSGEAIGIGAGVGAATCLGLSCMGSGVSLGLSLVGLGILGTPFGCLGCVALVGGPIGGYFLAAKSPDTIVVGAADGTPGTPGGSSEGSSPPPSSLPSDPAASPPPGAAPPAPMSRQQF